MPEVSDDDYAFLERVKAARIRFHDDDDDTENEESTSEDTDSEETSDDTSDETSDVNGEADHEDKEDTEVKTKKVPAKKTAAKRTAAKVTPKPTRRTRSGTGKSAAPRTPDSPPRSTHWTDKRLFGKGRG